MMWLDILLYISLFLVVRAGIFTRPPSDPNVPICTNASPMCAVAFNITTYGDSQVYHTDGEICRCPGNRYCSQDWNDPTDSITKVLYHETGEMIMKIRYCDLRLPDNRCENNQDVVILKGDTPFHYTIASDFQCRCNTRRRALYLTSSWRDGQYNFYNYSCGKPECNVDTNSADVCQVITNLGTRWDVKYDYPCRCPMGYACPMGRLPTVAFGTTQSRCVLSAGSESPRTSRRQNTRTSRRHSSRSSRRQNHRTSRRHRNRSN